MMIRLAAAALAALLMTLPLAAAETETVAPAELLQLSGIDTVLARFGTSIAAAPRSNGIDDARFLSAWERASARSFAADQLRDALDRALANRLSAADCGEIARFLTSPLGQRIARLERAAQTGDPIAVIAKGETRLLSLAPQRRADYEELFRLSGADMTFALMHESLRALALGMQLSRGDLELPWEEIDASVLRNLAGMDDSLARASTAAIAEAYRDLDDDELQQWLDFLRAPAARSFYGTIAASVGELLRAEMFELGETVASRLAAVDI